MVSREFPMAGKSRAAGNIHDSKANLTCGDHATARKGARLREAVFRAFRGVPGFAACPAGRPRRRHRRWRFRPAPPPAEPPPPPEPPKPVFDPLRANKSLEVGSFYMKRGNYDAAIDRFTDATQFEPGLARSYSLLGEAYEHKGDVDNALAAYRKYLQLLHNASRPRQNSEAHRKAGRASPGHAQEQTKQKSG